MSPELRKVNDNLVRQERGKFSGGTVVSNLTALERCIEGDEWDFVSGAIAEAAIALAISPQEVQRRLDAGETVKY